MSNWLLYGAYGYTGKLLVAEAVQRGHQPTLAGRNPAHLEPLAAQYSLPWLALDLQKQAALNEAIEPFDLVLHAAGPFSQTSDPMIRACLAGKTHYLDITGEIPVFENTLSYHKLAQSREVALISGVGFDIVPTDCLAAYVAQQLPGASELETAVHAGLALSAGTVKTALEQVSGGSAVRRNGRIQTMRFGEGRKNITFSNGETVECLPIPWGDLATAQQSTGIGNVTAYLSAPVVPGLGVMTAVSGFLLRAAPLRRLAQRLVARTVAGPDAETRQTARSYVWAQVRTSNGQAAQAWLDLPEIYHFTTLAALSAVEETLTRQPAGALTPSQAFTPDFVLTIPGAQRFDHLPI